MFTEVISLITMTEAVTDTGDVIDTVSSSREVFCRVVSANEKEKTFADTRGFRAEMVFILADRIDYNDEPYADYGGNRYRIIDTKFGDTSEEIRLVVTRWRSR